jgi:hypothetical protein
MRPPPSNTVPQDPPLVGGAKASYPKSRARKSAFLYEQMLPICFQYYLLFSFKFLAVASFPFTLSELLASRTGWMTPLLAIDEALVAFRGQARGRRGKSSFPDLRCAIETMVRKHRDGTSRCASFKVAASGTAAGRGELERDLRKREPSSP